ncbi:helix-turn-helix domain-containing protein [Algoriphagus taiwanensis]|uniref:HTH cro/C1-type domain-containing protein n=1 Tax=Algoriphagus taiwanensis TaxID=1445656 RepID=A0ABQ6Q317_9BACT|nr:hypothetical protein Ataiwa_27300 [Algoriphagus taiwanensis]
MAVGKQIRELRIAKGWTQAELAERCGLSERTIQRLEKDGSSPSLFTLKKVQEVLGEDFSSKLTESQSNIFQHFKRKFMNLITTHFPALILGSVALVLSLWGWSSLSPQDSLLEDVPVSIATVNCGTASECDIQVTLKSDTGEILWQKIFGGSSYDKAVAVLPVSDGGFLVLGSTSSFGQGNYDILLIKVDENGEFLWQKTYGEFFNDYAKDIVPLESGEGVKISGTQQTCTTPNVSDNCQTKDWEFSLSWSGKELV